ncbi:MAG TPA: ABC transporter permease [Candidatus Limnocylindria bacterium]|nr:ABC transporter permease [Candidatus Limnocylindria bacterium]
MEALYGIPVLGVLFQFLGYVIDVTPGIAPIVVGLAAPIALGALCGVMNERSGVVNIGIEGMMLAAAFAGFLAAGLWQQAFGGAEIGPWGATPALVVGVLAAIAVAVLLSVLHAWLCVTLAADQIISGTIINIAALGLTGYLNRLLISPNPRLGAGTFSSFNLPREVEDFPVVGWILDMFLSQGPIAMSVIVLVVVLQILLFRSRWGLRTRAVGEHPRAADTVGINVIGLRYRNVIVGGVFAGLAGAYLTLEGTGSFQNGMTAGRGFIALAAVIFGRWTPIGAWAGALLFAFSGAFGQAVRIRPPGADYPDLGAVMGAIPTQVYGALPYIMTIVILAGVVGRSIAPAAVGKPYTKESKAG